MIDLHLGRSTRGERTAIALSLGLAVWYVLVAIDSEGVAEMGDGVQHHLIARYAQIHPRLLLDHWGKPLFTLLALPFAQFGMDAMAVFNALLAVLTSWAAIRTLRPAGGFAQLSFPLFVMLAPLYRLMVVAGMTEILFGLLTVVTLLLLMQGRFVLAAIVASLTPFSRPEFIAFVPMVALWLAIQRRWKSLPFLLTGMALYSLIAWIALGDPLWYWNRDPYPSQSPYGSGDPWHFTDAMNAITGRPLMVLCVAALVLWGIVWRRDRERRGQHLLLLLCAAVPALLILIIHSYIWAMGLKGSAGLHRVIVTAVPMIGLFTAFTLARSGAMLLKERTLRVDIGWLIFLSVVIWSWTDLQLNRLFPVRPNPDQVILDQAGNMAQQYLKEGRQIFSTHPYMGLRSGVDPFDSSRYQGLWGAEGFDHRFHPGDLIFWDAQLGPNEAGVPLETLLDDPHFKVLGIWTPDHGHTVRNDQPYEIYLFERRDVRRGETVDTLIAGWGATPGLHVRLDTLACEAGGVERCLAEGEFPLEITAIPMPLAEVLFDDLLVDLAVIADGDHHLEMVYKQHIAGAHVRYDARPLKDGTSHFRFRVLPAAPGVEQSLYIYNISKRPFRLKDLRLVRHRWIQQPTDAQ